MCRSIKRLRPAAGGDGSPPTDAEIRAAALQYVRKISGFRAPSRANRPAFDHAVDEIAAASETLLGALTLRAENSTQRREGAKIAKQRGISAR